MTVFPARLDNSITLPSAVDSVTPIKADVVNRLRDAILAIEAAIGTNPGGSAGSVAARLTALENIGLSSVTFAGDLTGTTSTQQVVAIRSRPLANITPTAGQALVWNGSAWAPGDVGLASFDVTLSGGSLVECGATITHPAFTATYSSTPDSATLSDSDGGSQNVGTTSPITFNSNYNFTKTTFGSAVTFTMTAIKGASTKTASVTSHWGQLSYYGVGSAGSSGSAFVTSLSSSLQLSLAKTFTVTAGPSDKIYFCCRLVFSVPSFAIGGFVGGFFLSTNLSITNSHGVTETYSIYESDNVGLGTITVVVS